MKFRYKYSHKKFNIDFLQIFIIIAIYYHLSTKNKLVRQGCDRISVSRGVYNISDMKFDKNQMNFPTMT